MKNVVSICLIFSLIFSIACSSSGNENSTKTSAPSANLVAEQSVDAAPKIEKAKSTQPLTNEGNRKDSPAAPPETTAKKQLTEPTKKTINKEKEPTKQSIAESVKPSPKIDALVEKTEKTVENSPEVTKEKEEPKVEIPSKTTSDHSTWNALLQKNVNAAGKVNYQGFKAQKATLQKYLDDLAANPPVDEWSRKEKMAYWINAYNAFTVKLIVDNYPLSKITNLENGKPWDKKWIKLYNKTYSLNNIENDILRPIYKDARIHFAVNCAAQSCPPLLNQAWTADNLQANFEKQAKAFVNNSKFNKISADVVEVSKIFDWYKEDFGNIIDYLNKYSTTKIEDDATVSFKEYDWALNE